MVDNQHQKIKGYRDLSEEEISKMNACKDMAIEVGRLCNELAQFGSIDQRWLAIAQTDLQQGFMAMIRSIAKPETF